MLGTTRNWKPKLFTSELYVKPMETVKSVPVRVSVKEFDRAWLMPKS